MDEFYNALLSEKTDKIPDDFDWFAPLLGDWDFDYTDGYQNESSRHVKGEWIFRRVLNGTAIEDLFICLSRETMIEHPQPDGEYGVAIRVYNRADHCYDMSYVCEKGITLLQFKKEDEKLVGTVVTNDNEKWVFSDIKKETFHWQNITVLEDGSWRVNSDVLARRKKKPTSQ